MKILAFPRDPNPYQELLYAPMRAQGVTVSYLDGLTPSETLNLLTWIPLLVYYRFRGYSVFHMHWAYRLVPNISIWRTSIGKSVLYAHYIAFLWAIKFLGYRLVWTAHNVTPHEPLFADDMAARKHLVDAADVVIVHSDRTIQELKENNLTPHRIVMIPQGSYVGEYPKILQEV